MNLHQVWMHIQEDKYGRFQKELEKIKEQLY